VNADFRVIQNAETQSWDDFVRAHDGHLLQTSAWGNLKSRFGWSAYRVAVQADNGLVAAAQILFRRLGPSMTLAYVPRGPVADANDRDSLTQLYDAIQATAREYGAFALKMELGWINGVSGNFPETWNLKPGTCIQPHTTIHLDLTRDPATILAQMKPKWRYNIRLAERKGVTVREGARNDLPRFYELLKLTSVRDEFPIHTLDYYRAAFELLTKPDYARLFIAEYGGEMIAAIFVTAVGREAIYLYGASGNTHRERMPNHALHWHAIQWAKARGCTRYDLWGIGATAEANPSTALHSAQDAGHGLYQFKQGFGGNVVKYAGASDIIFSPWKFFLYERALAMRRGAMG